MKPLLLFLLLSNAALGQDKSPNIIECFGYKLTGLPAWILVTAVMIVTVSIIIAGFIAIIVPLWLWIIEKVVGFYKVHQILFTYMLNRKEFKNWLNSKK